MHDTPAGNPTHGLKSAVTSIYAWGRSAYIPRPS